MIVNWLNQSSVDDFNWNATAKLNDSDNDTRRHLTRTSEGGILSGHGPLESTLARFLVQAVIIIGLSRFLHIFLSKVRQPRVIAEIIGGICLGPSILGNIPGFTNAIFPKDSLPFLSTVANIGLVFYLFLVGLELDPKAFFNQLRRSAAISIAGIVLPFALGVASSWGLYSYLLVPNEYNIPFPSFLLFTGVAMSITAFPVLARILTEKKLLQTPVGLIAISAAAIDDAMAWTLLALVISILNASNNLIALYVFLLALGYALLLLIAIRPCLGLLFNRFLAKSSNPVTQFFVAAVFICIFISAWITELIGVHAIFGAFLLGLIIPRGNNVPIRLTEKIEDVIIIAFLPLFFASSGLKTNIGLLNDGMTWAWLIVVVVVACFGKLFGCTMSARLSGVPWREAISVGVLMNTKGLVELIVLNIGYDAKVINDRIFLIMVIMALVTTFMTSPIISYVYPLNIRKKTREFSIAALPATEGVIPQRKISVDVEQIRVLVCVDELYPIPTIAKLLWLFKTDGNRQDFIINTLKLLETSERSSSIMIASQIAEAIKTDPGLNMMNFFGSLIGAPTQSFMALSPVGDISDEVNYVAMNENCSLIVLPWFEQSVFGSILSSSPQEKIKNIVTKAMVTTAVYVPQASDKFEANMMTTARNILVVFYGGSDDCEAVKIALRFKRHGNVKLTVLKIDYAAGVVGNPHKKSSVMYDWRFTNGVDGMSARAEDVILLEDIRKTVSSSSDDKTILKEVVTQSLLKCVTNECQLSPYDLIIVGRNFEPVANMGAVFPGSIRTISTAPTEVYNLNNVESGNRPSLLRSLSEVNGKDKDVPFQRSLSSRDLANSEVDPMTDLRARPTIVTEILGTLGQNLYESAISSVLVVHRNVD